eukprot:1161687-Pelagomonas_calceolata.AAC.10
MCEVCIQYLKAETRLAIRIHGQAQEAPERRDGSFASLGVNICAHVQIQIFTFTGGLFRPILGGRVWGGRTSGGPYPPPHCPPCKANKPPKAMEVDSYQDISVLSKITLLWLSLKAQGQRPLALYGCFRRPYIEDNGPLLGVMQIRFTPEVQAGMQQQEKEMELRATPAVRPVGRPHMGPASRPAPVPKRPVDRPCASTHVQAPPAKPGRLLVFVQLSAHTDSLKSLQLFAPAFQQLKQQCKQGSRAASLGAHGTRVALMWQQVRGNPEEVQQ